MVESLINLLQIAWISTMSHVSVLISQMLLLVNLMQHAQTVMMGLVHVQTTMTYQLAPWNQSVMIHSVQLVTPLQAHISQVALITKMWAVYAKTYAILHHANLTHLVSRATDLCQVLQMVNVAALLIAICLPATSLLSAMILLIMPARVQIQVIHQLVISMHTA